MSNITESLFDTEGSEFEIETTAGVIKPIVSYASRLVNEIKLDISSDGVYYRAVDPANVACVEMDVPASAFETFDVEETVIGVNLKTLKSALRAGRQKESDSITITKSGDTLSTTVHRDYDGTEMDLQNRIRTIDPDSLRQRPDMPGMDTSAEATIPRKLFEDVVNQSGEYSDHISIGTEGNDLVFNGETDMNGMDAAVRDVVESEHDVEAMFSLDYFTNDAIKAFKSMGPDELTLKMETEYPIGIEFETELNEATAEGIWLQAPRVQE